jgi:hypothetical protein
MGSRQDSEMACMRNLSLEEEQACLGFGSDAEPHRCAIASMIHWPEGDSQCLCCEIRVVLSRAKDPKLSFVTFVTFVTHLRTVRA